jgi:hypothetical protein
MVEATAEPALVDVMKDVVNRAAAGTVFGAPVTHDGVTMVPVARISVWGGGDSGSGWEAGGRPASGTRAVARPLGAFVIAKGKVGWRPAVDVNKVIIGGQLVGIVALLTFRAIIAARRVRS